MSRTKLREWAKKVKERDGYECKICGSKKSLHAHHIIPRNKDDKLWYEISNGITLCSSCHAKTEGYQKGHKPTKDIIDKVRKANLGRAAWNKGKPWSLEARKKISESLIGRKLPSAVIEKLKGRIPWNKGREAPQHVKRLLVENNLKLWKERKEKGLPGPRKGTKASEEQKRKVSESLKRAYVEGRRKLGHSEETKRKISQTKRAKKIGKHGI